MKIDVAVSRTCNKLNQSFDDYERYRRNARAELSFNVQNVPDARIDRGTAACETDTLPTELPRPVRGTKYQSATECRLAS